MYFNSPFTIIHTFSYQKHKYLLFPLQRSVYQISDNVNNYGKKALMDIQHVIAKLIWINRWHNVNLFHQILNSTSPRPLFSNTFYLETQWIWCDTVAHLNASNRFCVNATQSDEIVLLQMFWLFFWTVKAESNQHVNHKCLEIMICVAFITSEECSKKPCQQKVKIRVTTFAYFEARHWGNLGNNDDHDVGAIHLPFCFVVFVVNLNSDSITNMTRISNSSAQVFDAVCWCNNDRYCFFCYSDLFSSQRMNLWWLFNRM